MNGFTKDNEINWEEQEGAIVREVLTQYTQFFKVPVEDITYNHEEGCYEINGIIRASIEEILWDDGYNVVIKYEVIGVGLIKEEEEIK